MADFNEAFAYMIRDEGGYVNDPRDSGGETYMGVARNKWPNWDGWSEVDRLKREAGFPSTLDASETLLDSVKRFYRLNFWRFDGVENQIVAAKLFDEAVNVGMETLVKLTQLSLRYVSGKGITVDAHYGPQTEALINQSDPAAFLAELRAQLAVHYCKLNRPDFLLGWLRRAVR